MRTPKFNFIPERQLNKDVESGGAFSVTVTKHNTLLFSKTDVGIYELEGKYVRLFADTEKKTLGWAIVEGKTGLEELNDARLMKVNPTSGIILLGIGRLLKAMGILEVTENMKLPVKTYVSPLQKDKIYYVELKKEPKEE